MRMITDHPFIEISEILIASLQHLKIFLLKLMRHMQKNKEEEN
jgi:hypothetical protein